MFADPCCIRSFWRFYQFDRKLESFYEADSFEIVQFRHLCSNIYWMKFRKRITILYSVNQPCAWCKEVKSTTLPEIWSELHPQSYLIRLCDDCSSSCAGG